MASQVEAKIPPIFKDFHTFLDDWLEIVVDSETWKSIERLLPSIGAESQANNKIEIPIVPVDLSHEAYTTCSQASCEHLLKATDRDIEVVDYLAKIV